MSKSITRRDALTGAGAVAGASLVVLPAVPAFAQSADERAAHHWAEFARAMDELSRDADGWIVNSAGRRNGDSWFKLSSIHIENHVEWHRSIILPNSGREV